MGGHVAVRRVEFGIVEAGGGDAALQVVRDQQCRDTAQAFERSNMTANPVGQALAPRRFAVGIVGRAEHGNEDRRLPNFTRHRISHRHRRAGVVDEQLLARRMRLAQADREPTDPLPIMGAEAAITVALGMLRLVFLPEEVERDAFTSQFAMHCGPIGFRAAAA